MRSVIWRSSLPAYGVLAAIFIFVLWVRPARAADADAAAAGDGGVETVLVTARRRSENEQNVPISMTALTAQSLADNGITSALNLSELVPSLQILSLNARNTNISIRGLGANIGLANDGLENGVGVYVDGVFLPRPAEATFDLSDIATVEELRGPQGTLYGKNTTSGAINITSELPTQTTQAHATIGFGDYGYDQYAGSLAGPLTGDGTLLGRISAFDNDRAGFIRNITTDKSTNDRHDFGFRGQLLYEPTGDVTVRLIADYSKQHEDCCTQVTEGVVTTLADGQALPFNFYQRAALAGYTPLPIAPFKRQTDAESPYWEIMEQGGTSAQIDWHVDGFDLTSITAYRFWNWNPENDADYTALPIVTVARQADQEKDFTQEFRLASPQGQPFEYSAGVFYFWEDDHGYGTQTLGADAPIWLLGASNATYQAALNGVGTLSQSDPRINSYAAYGQATWHILSDLDLTGGIRYTYEAKTGTYEQIVAGGPVVSTLPPAEQAGIAAVRSAVGLVAQSYGVKTNDSLPSGLATLTWRLDSDVSAYATYSRGVKSAGLNLSYLPPGTPQVVQPEYEDNYEIGIKSVWFDHRLVLNADAFWDNDTNYQATLLNTSVSVQQYIANIPGVRSRGFEADLRAEPIDGLSANLSGAYTDAVYTSYANAPDPIEDYTVVAGKLVTTGTRSLTGSALAATPKWAFSTGAEYAHDISSLGFGGWDGYLGSDVNYRSSFYSSADNSQYGVVRGYTITNLRAGLRTESGHWDLQLWIRNAFDTNYYEFIAPKSLGNSGLITAMPGDPRTWGVTLNFRY